MGVSNIYSSSRTLVRGGGADNIEGHKVWSAADNCTEMCFYLMRFGGFALWWYEAPNPGVRDPHYAKCFDASSSAPLNGLRIQTASQLNTMDLDPLLPQMNVTDWLSCLCMFSFDCMRWGGAER